MTEPIPLLQDTIQINNAEGHDSEINIHITYTFIYLYNIATRYVNLAQDDSIK